MRAAEGESLAGEHAVFVRAADLLVRAEKIADLSAAHAHIAGGHVHVGTDVAVKLGHETVAEAHYLGVGLPCRIEVAAALAAAHGQSGERILERLLEGEELHHRKIDVGLEAQSALVRSDGVVELHPETAVDVVGALVVKPRHAEYYLPVWLDQSFQNAVAAEKFLVFLHGGSERAEHFAHGLHEFRLARIFALCHFDDFGNIRHKSPPKNDSNLRTRRPRFLFSLPHLKNKSRVN